MNEPPEFRCWCPWNGDGGAMDDVGVNTEGFWAEGVPVAAGVLFLRLATSEEGKISPSSPASNERVEQKPSDDVMSSV